MHALVDIVFLLKICMFLKPSFEFEGRESNLRSVNVELKVLFEGLKVFNLCHIT